MDAVTIQIEPVIWQIGGPALLAGLVIGALIVGLLARRKRIELEEEIAATQVRLKDEEALKLERDQAVEAATNRLTEAFTDLSHRSLKSNSEHFLRLA